MTDTRSSPSPRSASHALVATFPTPRELEAYRFEVGHDDYVVLVFPTERVAAPPGLTAAEQEVVRAVIEGRSNAEIAKERGTSPRTIANQLQSISKKLGVSGRAELVQQCLGQSLVASGSPSRRAKGPTCHSQRVRVEASRGRRRGGETES